MVAQRPQSFMLISSPQCTAAMHGCGWLKAGGAVGHILFLYFLYVWCMCVFFFFFYVEDASFTVNKNQIALVYITPVA